MLLINLYNTFRCSGTKSPTSRQINTVFPCSPANLSLRYWRNIAQGAQGTSRENQCCKEQTGRNGWGLCETPTDNSFCVWLQVNILKVHMSLLSLEPLKCFVTETLLPFVSYYFLPPPRCEANRWTWVVKWNRRNVNLCSLSCLSWLCHLHLSSLLFSQTLVCTCRHKRAHALSWRPSSIQASYLTQICHIPHLELFLDHTLPELTLLPSSTSLWQNCNSPLAC